MAVEWLLLLLSVGLVVACGVFVAAEFAFVTVQRVAVEQAAERGDGGARGVLAALRTLSTQLSGAQVGITVTNLAIGFAAEPSIARLLHGPLTSAGVPEGAVDGVAVTIALVLATSATMVFGELLPKNLALAHPMRVARAVQRPQRLFTRLAGPLVAGLNSVANRILRLYGFEPTEELASARSAEELAGLVQRSAQQGTLPGPTAVLLSRALRFDERTADDVMTPRTRTVVVEADTSVAELLRTAKASGHSRFPVVRGGLDDVVGVAHVKKAVAVPVERRASTPVEAIMGKPHLVPGTLPADRLLPRLRSGGELALVVDEYGGVAGVVTLEDLLEELVGDLVDEHDPAVSSVSRRPDGVWRLSGLLRIDEVAEHTGISLPEDGPYETLGGFVTASLGRLAEVGDQVVIDDAVLEVVRLDGRRVDRVLVRTGPAPAGRHASGWGRPARPDPDRPGTRRPVSKRQD